MALATNWAADHIAALRTGLPVTFTASGDSMKYLIPDGSTVKVMPVEAGTPFVIGMVVLCELGCGQHCLHQVARIDGDNVLIQTTRGREDGWVTRTQIFGYCVSVEPPTKA